MARPVGKQVLPSIVYKDFVFPNNPATTSYKIDRSYVKHKYPELSGAELEDLSPNACVITGNGEFFGPNAYSNWNQLLREYKKVGVGNVSHPIFTDITRGLMVSLTADVEPMPEYVKYSFEIVADTEPTINECIGRYISVLSQAIDTSGSGAGGNGGGSGNGGGELVHTVVSGECLSVICARYAAKFSTVISWPKIATYNSLKNPHLIYPGDKIKIYYPT